MGISFFFLVKKLFILKFWASFILRPVVLIRKIFSALKMKMWGRV